MKKLFFYVSVVGLAVGAVYWLCRKGRSNTVTSKTVDKDVDFELTTKEEEISQNTSAVEEMYQAKRESAHAVNERHSEASSIMREAYSDIMEDFVEVFLGENDENAKEETKEHISVMKEIDSISYDLDKLLK